MNSDARPYQPFDEIALSGEQYDCHSEAVNSKIFIITSERTGSYLLCRAMHHYGLGIPHEYFNAMHIGIMGPRFGIADLADESRLMLDGAVRKTYISRLLEVQRVQFERYLDNAEGVEMFNGAHFIHLYREDLLGQAISFRVASLTGQWGTDAKVTTTPDPNPDWFNAGALDQAMDFFTEQDKRWRLFFAKNNIVPLSISFEVLCRDIPGAIQTISTQFNLPLDPQAQAYAEPRPERARPANTPSPGEIRARYLAARQTINPAGRHA